MPEDTHASTDINTDDLLTNNNALIVGIIIAGIAALWASLSHDRVLLLGVFFLIALALVYMRFPKSWVHVFWLGVVYFLLMFGPLIVFGLAHQSLWYILIGGGITVIGLALADLYIEHVKKARDEHSVVEYVSLGLWSLTMILFMAFSILAAYGVFAWTRGSSSFLYIFSEGFIVLAIPYILYKTEVVGATIIMNPEEILHFGEEKCPSCVANLTLETKICPNCNSPRLFKWCAICEAYTSVCRDCKEQTLWLDRCQYCNSALNDRIRCRACGQSFFSNEWTSEKS